MTNGTIKFFNAAKGYGFVTPDGGGPDIFLPSAAVTSVGATAIKQGQRVALQHVPDVKGPKIVSLELVKDAPSAAPVSSAGQVTIYCKLDADASADVIEAVRSTGAKLNLVDYLATPPSVDQLKRLAQMVGVTGQSLVRRYDPLFLALQLDDRFIAEQEFWTAIFEHPALINGPIISASGRAAICKTAAETLHFLKGDTAKAPAAPKTLSPRIAAMLRGEALPVVPRAEAAPSPAAPKPLQKTMPPVTEKPTVKVAVRPEPVVVAKAVVKSGAKPAPRKAAAKPAAKKPVKAAKKAKPVAKAKPAKKTKR